MQLNIFKDNEEEMIISQSHSLSLFVCIQSLVGYNVGQWESITIPMSAQSMHGGEGNHSFPGKILPSPSYKIMSQSRP